MSPSLIGEADDVPVRGVHFRGIVWVRDAQKRSQNHFIPAFFLLLLVSPCRILCNLPVYFAVHDIHKICVI